MLKRLVLWGPVPALMAAHLSISGCSNYDTGENGYGGSSGGATHTPATCGQKCQDYLVAHGLNDTIWFLWNQLIAGRKSGMQDTSGMCPLGGSAHITGTTGVSNGLDTADVVFELAACGKSNSMYSLTFTGEVSMVGSFMSSSDFTAMTFSSPSLDVSGGLDYLNDPAIDEACPVSFAQDGSGKSGTLSGRVCGREFNSETALDLGSGGSSAGGSGGGSGASGSGAGGSGNACRCYCPNGNDCTGATQSNPCGVDVNGIPEACGCPVNCP